MIFFFLIAPIVIIIPLSFNSVPFFTFTDAMLSFDPAGYSTKWYADFFTDLNWQGAVKNSFIIAIFSTIISTTLGTIAALGLSRSEMPAKTLVMGILISPMIVPLIISAAGMFFFYTNIGLASTHLGVILAHAALATPFVVITVTATLVGFDQSLIRAAAALGASPIVTFFKVIVPLDPARRHIRRLVCFRHLVRRGGSGQVRRQLRATDHTVGDVLRNTRTDQPHYPGGGDNADLIVCLPAGHPRVAAPAQRTVARHESRLTPIILSPFQPPPHG